MTTTKDSPTQLRTLSVHAYKTQIEVVAMGY